MATDHADKRGGLIGCGFFADNHLHGWRVVDGARIVAVCDLDRRRAEQAAERFNVPHVYADAAAMLDDQPLDFADIVTQPDSHRPLVEWAAARGVHVICQKPLAPNRADASAMVRACDAAGVRFMVHENFRWQGPMLALRRAAAELGRLHFARISFRSAYDVYATQPYLAEDEHFIIYDLGIHLLDLSRFFMGEPHRVHGHTQRVDPRIQGEDVATILLETADHAACIVEASYASRLERELFPQTLVHLEGRRGSATLGPDYQLTVLDGAVTRRHVPPRHWPWSRPPAQAIQDSVVAIQQHWLQCLADGREPDTSGRDNLRTLELVFAAYDSAEQGRAVAIGDSMVR